MHPYRKSHQKRNQHDPPVGIRLVRLVVPGKHRPEDHRGKEGRHRIDLGLHRRKPERIRKTVGHRTHDTGTEYSYGRCHRIGAVLFTDDNPPRKVYNRKIEEKYRKSGANRAHRIHRHGGVLRRDEHGKEPCKKLEDRVSRRVPDFELI